MADELKPVMNLVTLTPLESEIVHGALWRYYQHCQKTSANDPFNERLLKLRRKFLLR